MRSHAVSRPSRGSVRSSIGALALLLLAAAGGCGGESRYPVTGRVAAGGQPLADYAVAFHLPSGTPVDLAISDASGEFQIDDGGLPAGTYLIAVYPASELGFESTDLTAAEPERLTFSEDCRSPLSSGLQAEVKEQDENRFEWDLK